MDILVFFVLSPPQTFPKWQKQLFFSYLKIVKCDDFSIPGKAAPFSQDVPWAVGTLSKAGYFISSTALLNGTISSLRGSIILRNLYTTEFIAIPQCVSEMYNVVCNNKYSDKISPIFF